MIASIVSAIGALQSSVLIHVLPLVRYDREYCRSDCCVTTASFDTATCATIVLSVLQSPVLSVLQSPVLTLQLVCYGRQFSHCD